ncbi:MAG: sigma-70 family RNA polymerase sigma factor [Planctomycetales bacterium]|nr:sigma-70 family RNA polymerase sigma factor [Planctomycetales bacterium]
MSGSGFNDDLVERLKSGEEHAFVELFSIHRDRLKRMLEFRMDRRLRGREDASDILQEVYIDAHQRMSHYLKHPQLSFYVWLRQLTTQRLIDVHRRHLKAEKRDVKQEVGLNRNSLAATSASMAIQLAAYLATPSQIAMHAELVVQIEKAIDGMDEIDREVIALRHFEELRNSEVAEVLGLSDAAASNRYMRALARLREVLEEIPGFLDESE